jgi:hypothetical protein
MTRASRKEEGTMCNTHVDTRGESAGPRVSPCRGWCSRLAWLLALSLLLALAACAGEEASQTDQQTDPSGSLGTLQVPLLVVTPGGTAYRLNATFAITGPASFRLSSQDFPEDAPSLTRSLPVGRYTVTLQPDFELAERGEQGFAAVSADLLSPASQRVEVRTGTTTQLAYRFAPRRPPSDPTEPAPGNIEVVFSVDERTGPCTLPEARQIALAGVVDVSFDGKRCRLYAATSSGTIFVHDLIRQETSPLVQLPGSLGGMDISPNQDALLVADHGIAGLHRVDLRTTSTDLISFTPAFYEGGTYTVVFGNDATAFTTSSFQGSGWVPLRRVNLIDESYTEIASVRQNTMLALSANGSTLAYAEANISNGEFGRYALGEGTFAEGAANAFLYDIAINRDATQYAVPVYSGVLVYGFGERGFSALANLSSTGGGTLSGVYSPTRDELYVAVSGNGAGGAIQAFDTQTFQPLTPVAQGLDFGSFSSGGLGAGRLRVTRDGRLLMAVTATGVHLSPL